MTVVGLIAIGVFAGILGASLGIGGGIVFVPALVVFFAFPQHAAQGTSLAVIVPTAIIATVVHGRARRVDWSMAVSLAGGGLIGGLLGAWSALAIDGLVLRRMFAAFLVVMAFRMLAKTRRRVEAAP